MFKKTLNTLIAISAIPVFFAELIFRKQSDERHLLNTPIADKMANFTENHGGTIFDN